MAGNSILTDFQLQVEHALDLAGLDPASQARARRRVVVISVRGRGLDQMSRKRTSLALVWMKVLRASTSSPISVDTTASALAACSTVTWRRAVMVSCGSTMMLLVIILPALETKALLFTTHQIVFIVATI